LIALVAISELHYENVSGRDAQLVIAREYGFAGWIHTPDYFVLRTDSAGYEECRSALRFARKDFSRMPQDSITQIYGAGEL
jgi:hypothetical protein